MTDPAWLFQQFFSSFLNMVIRSALRAAKTGGELLEAYRQASQLDGRLKQYKSEETNVVSLGLSRWRRGP